MRPRVLLVAGAACNRSASPLNCDASALRYSSSHLHRGDADCPEEKLGRSNGEARRSKGEATEVLTGAVLSGLLLCVLGEHHKPARFGSALRLYRLQWEYNCSCAAQQAHKLKTAPSSLWQYASSSWHSAFSSCSYV